MTYMKRILALTLTILPLLAAAQLSSTQTIVAQVPFEFVVGTRTIPAGECTVRWASDGRQILMIHNAAAKAGLFASALTDETRNASGQYALVFHVVGGKYFLAAMQLANSRTIYRLPQSKAEAELLSQNMQPTETILVASLR